MRRRGLLTAAVAAPLGRGARAAPVQRVRPGDPLWPDAPRWAELHQAVGGRLSPVQPPLQACRASAAACGELFKRLKNPYAIGDDPALTQTSGWVDAWTPQASAYVVAAESAPDVAAAVDFARAHNLRLVVRGGGHSYLGTSNAADSLMVWTRRMADITLHDSFVARGSGAAGVPAVSMGAGAVWMHVYQRVTTEGGRYVQGGGCGTVGVAGLVQGGGFGSYSRGFGTAAASLLEAEVVTADGVVRIANAQSEPDLFWALRGGGGGGFGVVTRLTLRTHPLPAFVGIVAATIRARSDGAYRALLACYVRFHAANLVTPHWGELVNVRPGNRLEIFLEFQGIGAAEAEALWRPFRAEVEGMEVDVDRPMTIRAVPARRRWDEAFLRERVPGALLQDDRPGAAPNNVFWSANLSEAGHVLHGYQSVWLPATLLQPERQDSLVDALFTASRHWPIELHFQKGLAGAPAEAIAATRQTATNPAVLDAFVLAIIAGGGPPAFPGLAGHEPDLALARRNAARIDRATALLREVAPDAGSYVAESSYFEPEWQRRYWGANYARLREVKRRYDPEGLFFAHHGVGSEEWSADGFTRLA